LKSVATGQAAGNAFYWQYSMEVTANGNTWLLDVEKVVFDSAGG